MIDIRTTIRVHCEALRIKVLKKNDRLLEKQNIIISEIQYIHCSFKYLSVKLNTERIVCIYQNIHHKHNNIIL